MTSVLAPLLTEISTNNQTPSPSPLPKQDTKEYLADMLRELSAIAAWAELDRTRKLIDAAIEDIETTKED